MFLAYSELRDCHGRLRQLAVVRCHAIPQYRGIGIIKARLEVYHAGTLSTTIENTYVEQATATVTNFLPNFLPNFLHFRMTQHTRVTLVARNLFGNC